MAAAFAQPGAATNESSIRKAEIIVIVPTTVWRWLPFLNASEFCAWTVQVRAGPHSWERASQLAIEPPHSHFPLGVV
jgi:hypothetical protein